MNNNTTKNLKAFTRSVDFGIMSRSFFGIFSSKDTRKNLNNNFLQLIRHKKTMPKFTAGFTLLETLIAIFIFILAVTAVLSLVGDSVNSTNSLKDEITASYLADEVMDYIRNDRDTIAFQKTANGATSGDWQGFIEKYGYPSSNCFSSNGCEIDVLQQNYIQQCLSEKCTNISFYDDGITKFYGLYGNGSFEKTKFERKIRFSMPSGATDKFVMTVTVTWQNRTGVTRSKTYIGALYNWGA